MEDIKIFGLLNKSEDVLTPYFITSTSEEDASKFIVKYLTDSVNSVKNEQEKQIMIESIRGCSFVVLGGVDLITHELKSDYNVLFDLSDFMKEVKDGNKS